MSSNIPAPKPRPRPTPATSTNGTLRKPASSTSLRAATAEATPARSSQSTKPPTRSATGTTRPTLHTAKSSSSLSPSSASTAPPPPRTPVKSTSSTLRASTTSSAARSRVPPLKSPTKSPRRLQPEINLPEELVPQQKLSLKETIALKRAEAAKKKQQQLLHKSSLSQLGEDGDALPEDDQWNGGRGKPDGEEKEDALGRRSVKETIEKARETGNLNLASRSLTFLPTSLFAIHLGLDPELLPSQPPSVAEENKPSRTLAYYEIVDLTALKARDNNLTAVQPELSLFGSLKVLDFAKNALTAIPDSLGDLVCLVHLDLSENKLEQFPQTLSYLPSLAWLDLSKNVLKELAIAPLDPRANPLFSTLRSATDAPVLPALKTFNLADNKLVAGTIDLKTFPPKSVTKLDLSGNSLGLATALIESLGSSQHLRELSLRQTELEEGTFTGASGESAFASLQTLDLSENGWIKEADVRAYMRRPTSFSKGDTSTDGGVDVINVRIGLRDTREGWEIEADARARSKQAVSGDPTDDVDRGLEIGESRTGAAPVFAGGRKRVDVVPKPVVKEHWEEEIDEGLHTEAGRLRKRLAEEEAAAAAAAATAATVDEESPATKKEAKATLEKYYDSNARTITLPASKRQVHQRHASLVFRGGPKSEAGTDPNVPTETLPHSVIAAQPWSSTLRVLHLSNRRADVTFVLDRNVSLDKVEEVRLDGCGLADLVRVKEGVDALETKEGIFDVLGAMFPGLATLDLSENALTSVSGIVKLFFPDTHGKGLKVLRLNGNSIDSIAGLVEVAERFGRGESDGWRGEEIDIRDNQIPKLPPVLGLLQLDVLLVEGNAFRAPPRTVWLREGTQGLLKYLRNSAG